MNFSGKFTSYSVLDPNHKLIIRLKLDWNEISSCKKLDRNEIPRSDLIREFNGIERGSVDA